ncbi:hypothetical protein Tco_0076289, partial [Tanacetum coccineum]
HERWAIPLDKGLFEEIPGIDTSWGESVHPPFCGSASSSLFSKKVSSLNSRMNSLLILKLTLPPILGLTTPGAWFSRNNAKYCSMVRVSTSTPAIVPADIELRERREIMK